MTRTRKIEILPSVNRLSRNYLIFIKNDEKKKNLRFLEKFLFPIHTYFSKPAIINPEAATRGFL